MLPSLLILSELLSFKGKIWNKVCKTAWQTGDGHGFSCGFFQIPDSGDVCVSVCVFCVIRFIILTILKLNLQSIAVMLMISTCDACVCALLLLYICFTYDSSCSVSTFSSVTRVLLAKS